MQRNVFEMLLGRFITCKENSGLHQLQNLPRMFGGPRSDYHPAPSFPLCPQTAVWTSVSGLTEGLLCSLICWFRHLHPIGHSLI